MRCRERLCVWVSGTLQSGREKLLALVKDVTILYKEKNKFILRKFCGLIQAILTEDEKLRPGLHWELEKEKESEVTQSCPTLCNPMDCSLPGSSIHGIFRARILEWVVISSSRRSSQPRDWSLVSFIVGRRFTMWESWRRDCKRNLGQTVNVHLMMPFRLRLLGTGMVLLPSWPNRKRKFIQEEIWDETPRSNTQNHGPRGNYQPWQAL